MALAKIARIDSVEDHPREDAAHLSVMRIGDLQGVSMKVDSEGGGAVHRYMPGTAVMAVFEGAVVPEYLLRQGFWDEEKQRGMLPAGKQKNRMKATKFKDVMSQFIMFPVTPAADVEGEVYTVVGPTGETMNVTEGSDVAAFMGIVAGGA